MALRLLFASIIMMSLAGSAVATPTEGGAFPSDGLTQPNTVYRNAAVPTNMAGQPGSVDGTGKGAVYGDPVYVGPDLIHCNPGYFVPVNTTACVQCTSNYFCVGGDFYVPSNNDQGRQLCTSVSFTDSDTSDAIAQMGCPIENFEHALKAKAHYERTCYRSSSSAGSDEPSDCTGMHHCDTPTYGPCYITECEDGYYLWAQDGNEAHATQCRPGTYTIEYNANGGTGEQMPTTTCYFGQRCHTRSNTYNRDADGKIFLGWARSASATVAEFTNSAYVEDLTTVRWGTVVLYAVWGNCQACSACDGTSCEFVGVVNGKCTYNTACKTGYGNIQNGGEYNACCSPTSISCSAGEYLPANKVSCKPCPSGFYCEGGGFVVADHDQGITGACTDVTFEKTGCEEYGQDEWPEWAESATKPYAQTCHRATGPVGASTLSECTGEANCGAKTYVGVQNDQCKIICPSQYHLGICEDNKPCCLPNTYTVTYTCGDGATGAGAGDNVAYGAVFKPKSAYEVGCAKENASFYMWQIPGTATYFDPTNPDGYVWNFDSYQTLVANWNCNNGYAENRTTKECDPRLVTCAAGKYLKRGDTTCSNCPAGSYCEGGEFTYSLREDQGIKPCSEVSFTDSGEDTASGITCPDGSTKSNASATKQSYVQACYRITSPVGSSSASQCTGSANCGTKIYGVCYVESCATGYDKSPTTNATSCIISGAYTITYHLDGGTNFAGAPTSYTVETATITLGSPTKTGYTFDGWYDNSNFTGSKVTQIAKGSTGDKEFWAKWTPITKTCAAGKYLPKNSDTCTTCLENHYCVGGTFTYSTTVDQGIASCPSGQESNTGASSCTSIGVTCSAGKYLPKGTRTCAQCLGGYYCLGGTFPYSETENQGLTSCTQGQTSDPGATSSASCYLPPVICPAGYYLPTGSTTCEKCLTGTTSYEGENSCHVITVACTAGKYLPKNSDTCTTCLENHYCVGGTFTYSTTVDQGIASCPSGQESNAGASSCTSIGVTCSAGKYLKKATTACSACPANYYCVGGTFEYSETVDQGISECPTGTTSDTGASSCSPISATCSAGKYLPKNSNTCTTCPANSYCVGGTFAYSTYDQGITPCPAGHTSNAGASSCNPVSVTCSAGTYLPMGMTTCLTCPTGGCCMGGTFTFSATKDQGASCVNVTVTCDAGKYLPKSATACTTCVAGSYCVGGSFTYSTTTDQGITKCSTGYTSNAGAISASSCTLISVTCAAGTYLPGGRTASSLCPANNYCQGGTFTYSTSDQGITPCPENHSSPAGSASASSCVPNTINCVAGKYLPKNSNTCLTCTANHYCVGGAFVPSTTADQGIESCPANQTSNAGATSASSCSAVSVTCSAGKYLPKNSDTCTTCTAGYYCTGGSFTYSTTLDQGITKCSTGYTSASGASSCNPISVACDAGTYLKKETTTCSICLVNHYCVGGSFAYSTTADQGITSCPSGQESNAGASSCHSVTINCRAGTYLPMNALSCAVCPEGYACEGGSFTYSTTADQGIIKCSAGYTSNAGTSSCHIVTVTCVTGKYLKKAATACSTCPANYYCVSGTYEYSATEDQGIKPCATGYTSEAGAGSCTPKGATCVAGKYLPKNTTECSVCPVDNYCVGGTYEYSASADQGMAKCPSGLVSPQGTVDAGSCGKILHVGDNILYLTSDKQSTPALAARVGGTVYYARTTSGARPMNGTTRKSLRTKIGGIEYSIHDNTAQEE